MAYPAGRLCNRLWLFANFIGNSLEYDYGLANPAFCEYARYFEHLEGDLFCRYPPRPGRTAGPYLRRLVFEMLRVPLRAFSATGVRSSPLHAHIDIRHYRGAVRAFDLRGPEWKSALEKRVVFAEGLEFRDWGSLVKYRREILNFLAPRPAYLAAATEHARKARGNAGCLLCGIHLRLGDYQGYKSGQWFYSIEQYLAKMREFQDLFRDQAPVRFLVCSDAKLPHDAFKGLPVTFGSGQFIEDLFTLSQCDYLLGPPSTFSAWASFYGDVPLRFLFDLQPLNTLSFVTVAERFRRRVALAPPAGYGLPHTGFLELCQDPQEAAAGSFPGVPGAV